MQSEEMPPAGTEATTDERHSPTTTSQAQKRVAIGLSPRRPTARAVVQRMFAQDAFWLNVVVQAGDRVERVSPQAEMEAGDAARAIEAAVRRVTPGQMKRVTLFTEEPQNEPPNPQLPPQYQPPQRRSMGVV